MLCYMFDAPPFLLPQLVGLLPNNVAARSAQFPSFPPVTSSPRIAVTSRGMPRLTTGSVTGVSAVLRSRCL